jgi:hypothetical protein
MDKISKQSVEVGVSILAAGDKSPLMSETWVTQCWSAPTGPFNAYVDREGLLIELRHADGRRVVIDFDTVVEQIGARIFSR